VGSSLGLALGTGTPELPLAVEAALEPAGALEEDPDCEVRRASWAAEEGKCFVLEGLSWELGQEPGPWPGLLRGVCSDLDQCLVLGAGR